MFILKLHVWLVMKSWDPKFLTKIDLGMASPKAKEMQ